MERVLWEGSAQAKVILIMRKGPCLRCRITGLPVLSSQNASSELKPIPLSFFFSFLVLKKSKDELANTSSNYLKKATLRNQEALLKEHSPKVAGNRGMQGHVMKQCIKHTKPPERSRDLLEAVG